MTEIDQSNWDYLLSRGWTGVDLNEYVGNGGDLAELAQAWRQKEEPNPPANPLTDPLSYLMGRGYPLEELQAHMAKDISLAELASAERAAEQRGETLLEQTRDAGEQDMMSLFRPLTDFNEEEASWLVPGWIPEAQITLIAADGGIGKTTLWINLIAALSSGKRCVLDPPDYTREPMKVAFMTTEDSVRKKLRKKLREAGADLSNIVTMDLTADKSGALREFKFGSSAMSRTLKQFKFAACVFDPVQGFIPPTVNMGSRNAMRDCLAPLISLGEEVGTTFLIIVHTNKRKGAYGRDRIADSADLWDISRSVIMMGYTDQQRVKYLSNEKNNYTQLQETILFSVDDSGKIVKEGNTWKRDREFAQEAAEAKSTPKRNDCKEFIVKTLSQAPDYRMESNGLTNLAKSAGYAFSTIRDAKADLKKAGRIENYSSGSAKGGDRVWFTRLKALPGEIRNLPLDTPVPFDTPSA